VRDDHSGARRESDLLRDLEELKALEAEKQREPVSSPAFQRLADLIVQKTRRIFRRAEDDLLAHDSDRAEDRDH
jgi:hypothetical protein